MQYIKHEEQKKTVFRHKNKHREKSWKYDAPQSILTNFEVINIVMEYWVQCWLLLFKWNDFRG